MLLLAFLLVGYIYSTLVFSYFVRDADDKVLVEGVMIERCGTKDMSAHESQIVDQRLAPFLITRLRRLEDDLEDIISVPLYFRIITDTSGNGDAADNQITLQMKVMNEAHINYSFVFVLKAIDRTAYDAWFTMEQNSQEEITALKVGGTNALNVYSVQLSEGLLGWSTFPVSTLAGPDKDGVIVSYRTLPGGDLEPYNLGDTLVHEGGHWLALFHTFFLDGVCKSGSFSAGDFISDTLAERIPAYGCPIGRDTCVGSGFAGLDPVTSFMDYTDDRCMTHFTSQQASRMRLNWRAFRE